MGVSDSDDMTAMEYFQIFYSDAIFADLVRLTNENAQKKHDIPENNKGPDRCAVCSA